MKRIIIGFILMWTTGFYAQNNDFDQRLKLLTKQIDSIVQAKNKALKTALDSINRRVDHKEITKEEAKIVKKEIVKQYAEDLDYAIYKKTIELKQFAKNEKIIHEVKIDREKSDISYSIRIIKQNRKQYHDSHNDHYGTSSYFFIAAGINNTITDDQPETMDLSPYKIEDSRFFEMGLIWKAPVRKENIYLRYGASFVWNTLKPKGKKIHEIINDTIRFLPSGYDMEDSKLRNIWLSVPLSVEINLPKQRYSHLRLAVGVYGKLRLVTKQKLEYDDNGSNSKAVIKSSFNQHRFNYGLTGEIGGNWWSVYANYDLSPIFIHHNWHLFSLGLKIEM